MFRSIHYRFRGLPTPMAGLALGVASLGWCAENALPLGGWGQATGAVVASALLALLLVRYALHPESLMKDIAHPVLGSIVPTFAMALMVISRALHDALPNGSAALWCFAVGLHLLALLLFCRHRLREKILTNMVPSWFVPPVGIIVADVTFPGIETLEPIALALLALGMAAYAVMLPVMLYRLIFGGEIANGAKPTIAIMAAPASLSLAGYLTVVKEPSLLIVALLFGIAVLMTVAIYFCFWRLLRLQFSPGYAAFTFPMAIGATALYKLSALAASFPGGEAYAEQLRVMAHFELAVAAAVIFYVFALYMKNLRVFMQAEPAAPAAAPSKPAKENQTKQPSQTARTAAAS